MPDSKKPSPKKDKVDLHRADEFIFTQNADCYMVPTLCKLLHYRYAAVACSSIEIFMFIITLMTIMRFHFLGELTQFWMTLAITVFLILAVATTLLMVYGIVSERSHYLQPKITFMQIETGLFFTFTMLSIASMSLGMEFEHKVFHLYVNARTMENLFGPIWPFNVAVLTFFWAVLTICFSMIVQGAHDYLVDKIYCENLPLAEMSKR